MTFLQIGFKKVNISKKVRWPTT